MGMLVEENRRSVPPISYLLPVIARVVFQEQTVTVSRTGIKTDAGKHLFWKKKMKPKRLKKPFKFAW